MCKQSEPESFAIVDERRKRVIGLMAAILSAMHMQRADDLFGIANGTPDHEWKRVFSG